MSGLWRSCTRLNKEHEVLQAELLQVLCTSKASQGLFQGYKKENHMKRILDYIHSDMWGVTPTKSHDSACYYVIMDDYSQKIWVYFMQKKSEVFAKFKEWKVKVENQTGGKIKYLRVTMKVNIKMKGSWSFASVTPRFHEYGDITATYIAGHKYARICTLSISINKN